MVFYQNIKQQNSCSDSFRLRASYFNKSNKLNVAWLAKSSKGQEG